MTDHGILGEPGPAAHDEAGTDGRPAVTDASSESGREASTPPLSDTGAPPPGTRSLTLVNGVTDSPWAAFCLSVVSGERTVPPGAAFPEGGLYYGATAQLDEPTLAELASSGLAPSLVLASSPDAVKGLDCAGIFALAASLAVPKAQPDASVPASDTSRDAARGTTVRDAAPSSRDAALRSRDAALDAELGDAKSGVDAAVDGSVPVVPIPAVRVVALPLVPAGAFAVARGYLLVAGGCAGGPGVTDPSEKSVCGELYSETTPTLTEFVVAPPATAPRSSVALTVLGGTPALTQVDLGLVPPLHGDLVTVATRVVPGALRPASSYSGATASDIGAASTDALVELFAFGSDVPIYKQGWAPTLAAGGVTALENGSAYTLIVIGPFPGFAKRNWWNDPLVTVVQNR